MKQTKIFIRLIVSDWFVLRRLFSFTFLNRRISNYIFFLHVIRHFPSCLYYRNGFLHYTVLHQVGVHCLYLIACFRYAMIFYKIRISPKIALLGLHMRKKSKNESRNQFVTSYNEGIRFIGVIMWKYDCIITFNNIKIVK